MNYIYDIILNFKKNLYDFFDWNVDDDVVHIRKIPIFKISSEQLKEMKNNKIELDEQFLNKIKNKTEIFLNRSTKKLEKSFLVSDGLEVLAIKFDKDIYYSRLLIDEEVDTLEIIGRFDLVKIDYKIIGKNQIENLKTRREIELQNYLLNEIAILFKEDNLDKIKYIYYECFNEKSDCKDLMIKKLKDSLYKNEISMKLDQILKFTR